MKSILLILTFALAFANSCYSQNKTLADSILAIYKCEATPYLKNIAKLHFSNKKDTLAKEAIYARFNALLADISVIEKKVHQSITKSEKTKTDKLFIIRTTDSLYNVYIKDLPKEFKDKVIIKTKNL